MRTWIHIGLLTALVLSIVVAFAVLSQDERQLQHASANQTGGVPYGVVRLDENITSMVIQGENGNSVCKPEDGIIKLSAGDYRVDSWTAARTDAAGARWEMKGMLPPGRRGVFAVAHDKQTCLPCGEPIYCTIKSSRNSSGYSFEQKLEGRHGEQIVLTRNGSRPPAPRLRVRSKDGTYDRSISFAYG